MNLSTGNYISRPLTWTFLVLLCVFSTLGILDAHQRNGNMYQAYPTSLMLQSTGMAMVEKNPVWLERALSQQLPYERPNPSVVGLEKMPEAWVSSGWPVSVQKQAPVNVGPQLPLKPDSSPGADLCTNAADLARRGRGSGCVLSNGGNWSLGSIGSGSGSNATGSVYQNQNAVNEGAVNEGAVNAAGLVTHGSQGVNRRGFQNGYPVGDGCGGFSRPEATGVVREPAPAAGGAFRTSQEPKTQWTGEQRVEASGDRKSSQGPNSIPAVSVQRVDPVVVNPAGQQLIAKHNYDANPDSPLGRELSIRRMDQLVKINSHPHHDAWWLARNQKGDEGYIPATYVMVHTFMCLMILVERFIIFLFFNK